MEHSLRSWLALFLLLQSGAALATFHTFAIKQVFSNAAGTVQFVVLHEAANANGQHLPGGHALTASQSGVTRTFVFPGAPW